MAIFLFFFCSCTKSQYWTNDKIYSSDPANRLSFLSYKNPEESFSLEFYKKKNNLYGFIKCPKLLFNKREILISLENSKSKEILLGFLFSLFSGISTGTNLFSSS